MTLSSALGAAMSGLNVSQSGIDITSRNIANVGTPGYTRKVAQQTRAGRGGGAVRLGHGPRMAWGIARAQPYHAALIDSHPGAVFCASRGARVTPCPPLVPEMLHLRRDRGLTRSPLLPIARASNDPARRIRLGPSVM